MLLNYVPQDKAYEQLKNNIIHFKLMESLEHNNFIKIKEDQIELLLQNLQNFIIHISLFLMKLA